MSSCWYNKSRVSLDIFSKPEVNIEQNGIAMQHHLIPTNTLLCLRTICSIQAVNIWRFTMFKLRGRGDLFAICEYLVKSKRPQVATSWELARAPLLSFPSSITSTRLTFTFSNTFESVSFATCTCSLNFSQMHWGKGGANAPFYDSPGNEIYKTTNFRFQMKILCNMLQKWFMKILAHSCMHDQVYKEGPVVHIRHCTGCSTSVLAASGTCKCHSLDWFASRGHTQWSPCRQHLISLQSKVVRLLIRQNVNIDPNKYLSN